MHILTAPNKSLTTKAKNIIKIDSRIKRLVSNMVVCLEKQRDPQGVGLAGPQIGKNLNIFIIKPSPNSKVEVFINPKLINFFDKKSKTNRKHKETKKLEGCLSVPQIWAPIKRRYGIYVEYTNLEGIKINKKFTGYKSIILQHEMDHLNGILFTQRALEQKAQLFEEKGDKLVKLNNPGS